LQFTIRKTHWTYGHENCRIPIKDYVPVVSGW